MPEPSWLESRNNRNLRFRLVVPIMVLIAGLIFFYNNREVFFKKQDSRQIISKSLPVSALPVHRSEAPVAPEKDRTDTTPPKASQSLQQPQGVERPKNSISRADGSELPTVSERDTVNVSDIPCTLRGREGMRVVLSLELHMNSGTVKKEVLLKRENLKVMVQKVLAAKTLDELIVDSLRAQTKTAMNGILDRGAITDVTFRNFRIEKAQ